MLLDQSLWVTPDSLYHLVFSFIATVEHYGYSVQRSFSTLFAIRRVQEVGHVEILVLHPNQSAKVKIYTAGKVGNGIVEKRDVQVMKMLTDHILSEVQSAASGAADSILRKLPKKEKGGLGEVDKAMRIIDATLSVPIPPLEQRVVTWEHEGEIIIDTSADEKDTAGKPALIKGNGRKVTTAKNGNNKERKRRDAQRKTGFLIAVMEKQFMTQTDALDRYGGHSNLFAKYENDQEAQRYYREFMDLDNREFAKEVNKEKQAQEARKKKKGTDEVNEDNEV